MKKLKKIVLYILIMILVFLLLYWLASYVKCECMTKCYGHEFTDAYRDDTMLGEIHHLKVLDYSDTYARVYYVTENKGSGNLITFIKNESENCWELIEWEAIWSTSGSADGFVWPYIR